MVLGTPVVDHFCDGHPGRKVNGGKIPAADGDKDFFGLKIVRNGAGNSAGNKTGG